MYKLKTVVIFGQRNNAKKVKIWKEKKVPSFSAGLMSKKEEPIGPKNHRTKPHT